MKNAVVILIESRCFSVSLLILYIPVTTIISFSKIPFSFTITPVINSFPFFLSFLVFKRAVILVYKENYKLKKKMVSLVSVEVVFMHRILLQCQMDHTSVEGGVTVVKCHLPLLDWNSSYHS